VTKLRFSTWHLAIWGALAIIAMAIAWHSCLAYNKVAGTDKTPSHIARIVLAMNLGPYVGLIANPGGDRRLLLRLAPIPSVLLVAGIAPFVLLRRPVPLPVAVSAWMVYVLGCFVWFASAVLSLAVFLF
jgi:hypothetical protein